MANAESSQVTSDDLMKQINEQTSALTEETGQEPEVPEEEETQAEEEETTPSEEETAETSTEETTETPAKGKKAKGEPLYKIKVDGKEEELPLEKIMLYAQQGRYLERERAKDNQRIATLREENEKLRNQTTPFKPGTDRKALNEQVAQKLQEDLVGTLFEMLSFYDSQKTERQNSERMGEREFVREKQTDVPHWNEIKDSYQEFRDLGKTKEEAFLLAENDYMKTLFSTAIKQTQKETEKKAKMKQKAVLPVKEKVSKSGGIPTLEEAAKLTSAELAKRLRHVRNEGW